jgi:hypothetical protein
MNLYIESQFMLIDDKYSHHVIINTDVQQSRRISNGEEFYTLEDAQFYLHIDCSIRSLLYPSVKYQLLVRYLIGRILRSQLLHHIIREPGNAKLLLLECDPPRDDLTK